MNSGVGPTLKSRVTEAVRVAPVVDLHTHLFAPSFGMTLWGVDELLTYHYLVAETLRAEPHIAPEDFFARPKADQADLVWDSLFVKRTPLSEATAGVVTVFKALELNPSAPDLREARVFFASRHPTRHVDDVLRIAGVRTLVMTNDPLHPVERKCWDEGATQDPRFAAALRIDPILNDWPAAATKLAADGYKVSPAPDSGPCSEVRRWLDTWIEKMKPRYLAVSLPPSFAYPDSSIRIGLLTDAVLPACRDHDLPFAMMIGVRKQVNPRLGDAGDSMGVADIGAVERLAADHPQNRFLVTTLAQENVHHLNVAARKFANILPFGCWWFMNQPSLVEETTMLRLEMLGLTFVPQHSDARVLEQLIYKWRHTRRAVSNVLTERYEAIEASGKLIARYEIERDARALMGDIAAGWLGLDAMVHDDDSGGAG